ncbi:TonB-dependent siderophore receptor [Xanthobacter sp. YC-JY1]|uniref:TonB-dependent receptor n=1 Tax=Xanthobacter sp. YC-JY1 TaxID=2419844 RepID=UPI001EFFB203|nr:TonB-dependent siderophore receptor [Xanthobacter sp. YC-JY1]
MGALSTLRPAMSRSTVSAGLAMTLSAVPLAEAFAQQATAPSGTDADLPTIVVDADGEPVNSLEATTGLSRLPGTLQDTPQTVTVISQQTMQQQGVTTLEQALRNVPGVTVGIGEGGGGMNGDQFRIRGFQAKGDVFVNGLRDFGVYVRDSFAYENVEVFKGPSSESFGSGTTGGAINMQLKQAHRGDKYDVDGQFGSGPLYRGVFDFNKQIDDTTAARIVGMFNDQDIVDRDHVEANRYGLMGSLGFGLGTNQTLYLNYLYQHGDRTPDYGVPVVTPLFNDVKKFGAVGQPVTEWGVPRSNFYGKETDRDITDTNMFTANYKKEINDWLTFTNDSRVGYYTRDFATSVPGCSNGSTNTVPATPKTYAASCTGQFFAGNNPAITFGGGNPGYLQESLAAENVATMVAKFNTGFLRHELVAGIDYYFVNDSRNLIALSGSKGLSTIWNPVYANTTGYFLYENPFGNNGQKISNTYDFGAFASDRIWFTDQLSILGGIRWDNYSTDYKYWCVDAQGTSTVPGCLKSKGTWIYADSDTRFFSPKASLIWEPTKTQTYYVSYAKSFSPQGGFPTNDVTVVNPVQNNLSPEDNETWEAGAKVSVLDGRLGLTAALFRIDKSNVFYTDPVTGDSVESGENQRVQGVELGVTGTITDAWTIQAGYAYYASEILTSTTLSYVGNQVPFVSPNNFTLWTTYDLIKGGVVRAIPGQLLVGGGITYADGYFTNSANTAIIPETFSLDALISYKHENYRVALNGYNLTNALNYSAGWGNRAIPASGRSFTLSVGYTF